MLSGRSKDEAFDIAGFGSNGRSICSRNAGSDGLTMGSTIIAASSSEQHGSIAVQGTFAANDLVLATFSFKRPAKFFLPRVGHLAFASGWRKNARPRGYLTQRTPLAEISSDRAVDREVHAIGGHPASTRSFTFW